MDAKRLRPAIVRHLEDLPRQYAALEHAMASFGEDFDLQEFKAAYNTSDDMDAYNRVQAVERALGRVQNYVGGSPKQASSSRLCRDRRHAWSATQIAFEAMRDAKIITARLCSRLVQAQNARTRIEHSYVQTPAGDVHRAAILVRDTARDFIGSYRVGSSRTSRNPSPDRARGARFTRTPDRRHRPPVARLVVRVDLRRLRIRVAHPVLQRAHRRAGGRHPRAERVAQLVERDPVDVRAVDRLLEAADELRAVERLAGFGMAEDEIAVARVDRPRAQIERARRDPLGHRHRTARAGRLRIAELTADVRGHDPDLARVEVDIAPAQAQQLALAQSGHRRRQIQRRLDPAEGVVRVRRGEQLLELGLARGTGSASRSSSTSADRRA